MPALFRAARSQGAAPVRAAQFRGQCGFGGFARVSAAQPGDSWRGQADFAASASFDALWRGQVDFSGRTGATPLFLGQADFQGGWANPPVDPLYRGQVDFQGAAFQPRIFRGQVDFSGRVAFDNLYRGQFGFSGGVAFADLYRGQFGFSGIASPARAFSGQFDMQGLAKFAPVDGGTTNYINDTNPGFLRRAQLRIPASSWQVTGTTPVVVYMIEFATVPLKDTAHSGFFTKSLATDGYLDVQVEIGAAIAADGSGGTVVPSQAIYHDPATGDLCLAFLITADPTNGNDVFIYIGNSSMPAPTAKAFSGFAQVIDMATGKDLSGNERHLLAPTGFTLPAATTLNGMPAGLFDGLTNLLAAAPWASWGGWTAATADIWSKADADAIGTNRGLFCEGVKDAEGAENSFSLYWRSGNAAGTRVNLIFGGFLTNGTPDLTFTGTASNKHSTDDALMVLRWQDANPDEAAQIWSNGVQFDQDSFATTTGTQIIAAPGAGAVEMIGYGPSHFSSTPHFQELPWKGKLGLFRLRTFRAANGLLRTEYANQSDPRSFYGLGGWDARGDANRAPIAIPDRPADITYSNSGTLIDLIGNDIDPDAGTLSLDGSGFSNAVNCTVIKDTTTGKALVTGLTVPTTAYVASFNYTVQDNGSPIKKSVSKCIVNIVAATGAVEMPTPLRTIWGNTGFTVGLDETKLDAVLAATGTPAAWPTGVSVSGTQTPRTLQPGDHVMLAGTFNNDRTITQNGTAANPIVFRALGTAGAFPTAPVIAKGTWRLDGSYKRLWGFRFNRNTATKSGGKWLCGRLQFGLYQAADTSKTPAVPQVIAPSSGNGAVRCEFTDWTRAYAVLPYGNGGTDQPGCYLWYCTFHDPYGWGLDGSGDPSPIGSQSNTLRMAVRSQEDSGHPGGIVGSFPYNFHIKRCYWHDFPDKPLAGSANYNSGQDDACEWGQTGPAIGQAKFTCTRSGGHVASVTDYLHANLLMEDCVIENHAESGGAFIDLKCGGNWLQRIRADNCNGRIDNRWGPFNTWEDIVFQNGSPGAWSHGWGHIFSRISGGTLTLTSGDKNDAGTFVDGHQSAENCIVNDRTGGISITNPGGYNYEQARNIAIHRANPTPGTANNADRVGCTFDGGNSPAAPGSTTAGTVPTAAEVGHAAPWVG